MSLASKLRAALAAQDAGPRRIVLDEADSRLTCDLVGSDRLACEVKGLSLATDALAGASMEKLKEVAEQLSGRLTYLLEAVGPVEFDADRCTVQMRSKPPQRDEDSAAYYELLVERGGQLSLCRYRKAPGQPREAVPAVFTQEVLLRLVDDFVAVL